MTLLASPDDIAVSEEDLDPSEVQAALRVILDSAEFVRNPSSSKFLRFAVEETLEGRGDRLKAFTIATLALGRSASFDPQANSIVRVQAMRLRELLAGYYAGPGAESPLQILLPRGSYQPRFVRVSPPAEPAAPAAPGSGARAASFRRSPRAIAIALLALGALAVAGVYATLHLAPPSAPTAVAPLEEGPVVIVAAPEIIGPQPDGESFPGRLLASIEGGLSAFDFISVRRAESAGPGAGSPDYSLAGQFVRTAEGKYEVYLRLVREPTGDVLWSHAYADVNPGDGPALETLSRIVVATVGDVGGGVIFSDLRERLFQAGQPLTGYRCILAGAAYMRERNEDIRASTRNCLTPKSPPTPTIIAP